MLNINDSVKQSIESQIKKLETEEKQLNMLYERNMRVSNDYYYVSGARSRAKRDAIKNQNRLDEIVNRKLELMRELKSI